MVTTGKSPERTDVHCTGVVEQINGRKPARRRGPPYSLMTLAAVLLTMPKINLDEETVSRLDSLRVEDESYDEIVNELINIYEAEELTLFHSGD